jgi:hypothetical protein
MQSRILVPSATPTTLRLVEETTVYQVRDLSLQGALISGGPTWTYSESRAAVLSVAGHEPLTVNAISIGTNPFTGSVAVAFEGSPPELLRLIADAVLLEESS